MHFALVYVYTLLKHGPQSFQWLPLCVYSTAPKYPLVLLPIPRMLNLILLCWIWEVPRDIWRFPVSWLCSWYLQKYVISFSPASAAPCRCSMHSAVMGMEQMALGTVQCVSPEVCTQPSCPLCLMDGVSSKEPLELQHSWVSSPSFPMRLGKSLLRVIMHSGRWMEKFLLCIIHVSPQGQSLK